MSLRFLTSLVLALSLAACSSVKLLPDGDYLIATTVSDSPDRSTTVSGKYRCPVENGKPKIGECTLKDPKSEDRTTGPTVAGQAVVGVVSGMGPALVGARTARSVAQIMQCKKEGGNNCGDVNNVTVNQDLIMPCGGPACTGTGTGTP
jgi:hypothetical protein